jgi:hypothetical protein
MLWKFSILDPSPSRGVNVKCRIKVETTVCYRKKISMEIRIFIQSEYVPSTRQWLQQRISKQITQYEE